MKVLLAPTFELAIQAKQKYNPEVTVEAEYGDNVVDGGIYTAAHHGSRAENVPPCVDENLYQFAGKDVTILVSHIDLDTIGGIVQATQPYNEFRQSFFWKLAGLIDINGPHMLEKLLNEKFSNEKDQDYLRRAINAYWAYNKDAQQRRPRLPQNEIVDITSSILEDIDALRKIVDCFEADPETMPILQWKIKSESQPFFDAGEKFQAELKKLDEETLIEQHGRLLVRVSPVFANALYRPDADIIFCFNTKFKSATLSIAQSEPGFDCAKIMQEIFGDGAGGRDNIAGSPRGKVISLKEFTTAIDKLVLRLSENANRISTCKKCQWTGHVYINSDNQEECGNCHEINSFI